MLVTPLLAVKPSFEKSPNTALRLKNRLAVGENYGFSLLFSVRLVFENFSSAAILLTNQCKLFV